LEKTGQKENSDYGDSARIYISKCNSNLNPNCKSDDAINKFLKDIQMRMYMFEEEPHLSSTNLNNFFKTS